VENDVLDAVTGDDAKPVVKEAVKEVVKKVVEKPDQTMLLGKLIEWAEACNTEDELKSIWKSNQSKIDDIKSSDADGYKRLQARFAELKLKLKGE
jgi:hypothetical protein